MPDIPMPKTQVCRDCRTEYALTITNFSPNPTARFGFMLACRACRAGEARNYYRSNAETLREKARKRRQERSVAFRAMGLYDVA